MIEEAKHFKEYGWMLHEATGALVINRKAARELSEKLIEWLDDFSESKEAYFYNIKLRDIL